MMVPLCILPFDVRRITLYTLAMIRSFKNSETERVFNRFRSMRLPPDIQRVAYRKLRMLHQARVLHDLAVFPANHLEKLKGDRSGEYSIRINDQ
jgi:proteic killer suppression protein